jgi:ribosome-binding factor A
MAKFGERQGSRPPSQRQLQVGEEIRHLLSSIFMRGEIHNPELSSVSITVSEVRISPDLKNATAYILPLAGHNKESVLKILNENANFLRHLVSKSMRLRQAPRLGFKLDQSYDNAGRIAELLNHPTVSRDLVAPASGE